MNPSDHMSLGKKEEIRATPYPDTPSGARAALSFCWIGREKSFLPEASMRSRRFLEIPWFITWNTPHVVHAWPTSSMVFGSSRSITGTDSVMLESPEGNPSSDAHACESGNSFTEFKSKCLSRRPEWGLRSSEILEGIVN